MFRFSKILKSQLLWINLDYLYTLSFTLWAEGHRRAQLYWWLVWKDFTFLPTPGPSSVWRWASGFHKPRGWASPGCLHSIESNPATKKLRSRTRLCPPPGPALLSQLRSWSYGRRRWKISRHCRCLLLHHSQVLRLDYAEHRIGNRLAEKRIKA